MGTTRYGGESKSHQRTPIEKTSTEEISVSNRDDGKWIYFDNSNERNAWVDPGQLTQGQTASKRRQYFVFGGIKKVFFIMNFSSLIKWLMLLAINKKWIVLTTHYLQNVLNRITWKSDFVTWQCTGLHDKNFQGNFLKIGFVCSPSSSVFTGDCSFGKTFVPVVGAQIDWASRR